MAIPTIQLFPPAPSRQDPDTFANKADSFLGHLETFDDEINASINEINTVAEEIDTNTTLALNSATSATAAANFKGTWTSLGSSAVNIPASVEHNGIVWTLLQNLGDASSETPGSSPDYWIKTTPEMLTLSVGLMNPGEVAVVNAAGDDFVGQNINKISSTAFFGIGV